MTRVLAALACLLVVGCAETPRTTPTTVAPTDPPATAATTAAPTTTPTTTSDRPRVWEPAPIPRVGADQAQRSMFGTTGTPRRRF
jgi:hypothetical protein